MTDDEAQQLKECECPARKALEEIYQTLSRTDVWLKVGPSIAGDLWELVRAVLSAPCPCEELRAASQERERVLREELARALNNNHQRNLELDALHYVWCDGGCGGGVHRFGPNPPLTAEIVEAAARNAERLRRWLLNNEYRKKVAATPGGTKEKP